MDGGGWTLPLDCATEALFYRRDGAFASAARREAEKNARSKGKGKGKDQGKGKGAKPKKAGKKKIRASKEDRVLANLQHFDLEEEASSEGGLLILKRRPPQEEAS